MFPIFELKNMLLSEDGLRETTSRLNLHPHFNHSLIVERHTAIAAVLNSFNCDVGVNENDTLLNAITKQNNVAITTLEVRDDVDFVVEAVDLIVFRNDDIISVYLKGLSGSNSTPFEGYNFNQTETGTYFLSEVVYFEVKLYKGEALATYGTRMWSCAEKGDVMINDRPRKPKFTDLRGECKEILGPIKVYIDSSKGYDDE